MKCTTYHLTLCLALLFTLQAHGSITFDLPSTSSPATMYDAGFFQGGSLLEIASSGQINIIGTTGYNWITNADGSLGAFMDYPPGYSYANIGATNYPTLYGGDGINHFDGGGANYDTSPNAVLGAFGFAGKMTTDTTDPDAIRFGAVVGTFSALPTREDWFYIGYGTSVVVPTAGAHLFLAVSDSSHANNTGSYSIAISQSSQPIPEPSSLLIFSCMFATVGTLTYLRRKRHTNQCGHAHRL